MLLSDIPTFDAIDDALVDHGYAIIPDFVSPQLAFDMAAEASQLRDAGAMRRAGVGKGAELSVNDALRGDFIHWLDHDALGAACRHYLDQVEALRQSVNRSLALGLFEFEGHYAIYPPGSYYRKHLDQFQQDSRRTLTTILYLNDSWTTQDGGQLRLYLDDNDPESFRDIMPIGGTLVTFLSSRFWHEVMPARRDRMSLTGWFKTRGGVT